MMKVPEFPKNPAGGDDVAQQRFGALPVDGEIVVHEEDGDLALRSAGALLEQKHFINDALIRAEADGIAEEPRDGAELAAVGTAAAALDGDDVKGLPGMAVVLHDAAEKAGDAVKLIDVELVPRNLGIVLEGGFLLLPEGIHGSIDFLQLSAGGVGDDARPGFIDRKSTRLNS